MSEISLEARIDSLALDSVDQETIKDIIRDALELSPTGYVTIMTDLCFQLWNLLEDNISDDEFVEDSTENKTMKELTETTK